MSTITTKDGTQIDYNERGQGQPVVFSHGWPLSAVFFEDQMFFLTSRDAVASRMTAAYVNHAEASAYARCAARSATGSSRTIVTCMRNSAA
jgi:pimeloyl-ACP methyl ester carboxylesterase